MAILVLFFNPIDLLFSLVNIKLADMPTLFFTSCSMLIGIWLQIKYIKKQGFELNTPVITFEAILKEPKKARIAHGKIYSNKEEMEQDGVTPRC